MTTDYRGGRRPAVDGACAAETYDLTNIGTLFAFALVCGGVLILRVKEPDRPRPFKVPFVWVLAPAGVAACLFVMKGLPVQAWERFGIWLAIGLVIYFAYAIATAISGTRPDSRLTSGWRAGPRFIEAAAWRVRDAHARRAGRGHHQGGRPCGRRSDPPVAAIHQPARRLCVAGPQRVTCSSIAANAAWFSTFRIRRRTRFWNRCCRKWMWSLRASARPRRSDGCVRSPAARARHPRLIHVALTGYGQTGPYAERPGHDLNYVAVSGVLAADRPEPAHLPGMFIADVGGGAMTAVVAVLAALFGRERSGAGATLDLSMHDAALYWVMLPGAGSHRWRCRGGLGELPTFSDHACYNVYETRDGRQVALGALELKFWMRSATPSGGPILREAAHGSRRSGDHARSARSVSSRTQAEWLAFFEGRDVPVAGEHTGRGVFGPTLPHAEPWSALGLRAVRAPFGITARPLGPAPNVGRILTTFCGRWHKITNWGSRPEATQEHYGARLDCRPRSAGRNLKNIDVDLARSTGRDHRIRVRKVLTGV